MSEDGPEFHAWCAPTDIPDACAAALSAFVSPDKTCTLRIYSGSYEVPAWHHDVPLPAVIERVRAAFAPETAMGVDFWLVLPSGTELLFSAGFSPEKWKYNSSSGYLSASPDDRRRLLVPRLNVAVGSGRRSVETEAAIWSIRTQQDVEEILLRLCAPNGRRYVTTGACTDFQWHAPVETYATYHVDWNVARDLALSWIYLCDGTWMNDAAGLPLDALRARVEAAPPGARVPVARHVERRDEHLSLAMDARRPGVRTTRWPARTALPGDDELTREQVLAALSTAPLTLLEALEAAAMPDNEWRAIKSAAIETIEAAKQGAPTYEVDVTTRKHVRFIEQHAPFHVRRLPNGGVMLATHPYRILWPLWADALALLGIREAT